MCGENACTHKPGDQGWGRGRKPVISVSWEDAKQYAAWLAKKTGQPYRLLTEAEWEYAARGRPRLRNSALLLRRYRQLSAGELRRQLRLQRRQAGYLSPEDGGLGSLPRNGFGLHEMHGNVWEWVEDCYNSYAGAPSDGSAMAPNCSFRILRGGAWNYYPQLLRSAYRYATAGAVRLDNIGFRVARSM